MNNKYFVIHDVDENGKKIPKGWRLLHTWMVGEYKQYVEFKAITDESEFDMYKNLSKYVGGKIKVVTKEQLITYMKKWEKADEEYQFKPSKAYMKLIRE